MQNKIQVDKCVAAIKGMLPQSTQPLIGIVLGTGLGDFAEKAENKQFIPYSSLPDFPQSSVESHVGRFVFGTISGVPVVLQQGRCHLYEGYSPKEVCTGVRVMAGLGIKGLVVTNAAGAINTQFSTGNLMLIEDFINFTGKSPITGANEEDWGPRFPDVSEPFDAALSQVLEQTALEIGIRLERGVYIGTQGPQFDTRAEIRMFRRWGADAVGMSTVLEVIAANHLGLKVAGISSLTNKNLADCLAKVTLEEVISVGKITGTNLANLLFASLPKMATALK